MTKNLRENVEHIKEIVLCGFPAKYIGNETALEAYAQGKVDAWEGASARLLELFQSHCRESLKRVRLERPDWGGSVANEVYDRLNKRLNKKIDTELERVEGGDKKDGF